VNKFSIETAKTSDGRRYSKSVSFDIAEYGAGAVSWIGVVLKQMEERSRTSAYPISEIDLFKKVFGELKNNVACRKIYRERPSAITRKEMHILFTEMEQCIEMSFNWSPAVQAKASMHFRRWMIGLVPENEFAESLNRHSISFRTRLTGRYPSRTILGTKNRDSDELAGIPPIDALPHSNVRDLKGQISKRLDGDASNLISACVSQLEFWAEIRHRLVELGSMEYGEPELQIARSYLINGVGRDRHLREASSIEPKRLMGAVAKLCHDKSFVRTGKANTKINRSPISLTMIELLGVTNDQIESVPHSQILQMPLRAHLHELTAAFVVLLVHTAWNAASLREMPVNCVKPVANGFVIQGFKRKTGQYTPEVLIDASHRGAIAALKLVIWNNARLRSFGFIAPDDENSWYPWPKQHTRPMGCLGKPIRLLAKKYSLPPFTLDQIRTHMLFRLALKHGTPEAARVSAGHSSITVTGRYLDQFLASVLSKSINLEFQRRLEAKIVSDKAGFGTKLPSVHGQTDEPLLKPIGDGTSCANPGSPPNTEWLVGSHCGAKNCHSGQGCVNNRIEITRSRLEEIVRWNAYYRSNWAALYERNPSAFEKYHGPAILMNFALMDYLRKSAYRVQVEQAIDRLKLEVSI
jgi:hypothetical protein